MFVGWLVPDGFFITLSHPVPKRGVGEGWKRGLFENLFNAHHSRPFRLYLSLLGIFPKPEVPPSPSLPHQSHIHINTQLIPILEESLLTICSLGVQTQTLSPSYLLPASTRFIPTAQIRDILIHEAFRGFEVRYYLAIVVEGEWDVVVVFPVSLLFFAYFFFFVGGGKEVFGNLLFFLFSYFEKRTPPKKGEEGGGLGF